MFRDENEDYYKIFVGAPKKIGEKFVYLIKAFDN